MPFYSIDGVVPIVDPASFVHPTASVIGDVIIEAGCYIGPGASLRGDLGRLIMKGGGNLQDGCIVHGFPDSDTVLEEDAHIGHGAVVHGATIRRNALIGMNAVIMDGAVVGESAFVAAMAFVKAGFEVPARHLAAGIPAKLVRPLTDQELAWKVAGTREYQELARRCLASFKEVAPLTAAEPNRPRLRLDPKAVIPLYKVKEGG